MIKKVYTKAGRSCRVTFELPPGLAQRSAQVCGEFNEWKTDCQPMQRRRDGSYRFSVSLTPGREYRFRYLLDGQRWENDTHADGAVPNGFGSEDSILKT
jgi:1,4-alpha-glucan branching enzyme